MIVKLSENTPSCGMGCNMRMKWSEVFSSNTTERVIMDNDSYKYEVTTRKVREILYQNTPTTIKSKRSIWEIVSEHAEVILNGTIFTDGSWKDERSTMEKLFRIDAKNNRSSAAVVIIDNSDDWKSREAITINIKAETANVKEQVNNAFTMEATAILAAAQIVSWYKSNARITTDCKGLSDKINFSYTESWANHGQSQILRAIHVLYKGKINWTRSHPEIRKKPNEYDKSDFGIAMADAACEGELRSSTRTQHVKTMMEEIKYLKIYHYEVTMEDVLKEMLSCLPYAWTKEKIPIIVPIQSFRDNNRKEEYLEMRDQWNVDKEGNIRKVWGSTTIEHGGAISRAKGYRSKIESTKILYDWVEHGRNRAKKENNAYDAEIAGQCRECGIPDSQYHIIMECITKKLTDIRMETDARIDLYINDIEKKKGNALNSIQKLEIW